MGVWSSRFDWVARARAFDDYHEMIRREAIEQAERTRATDIAERERMLDEELIAAKEGLVARLKQMAQFPIVRQEHTSEDGKTVTHIYPARWSFNTLVRGIEAMSAAQDRDGAGSGDRHDPLAETFLGGLNTVKEIQVEDLSE